MIKTYKILESEKQKSIYYKCIVIDTLKIFKFLTGRRYNDKKRLL